MNARQIEIETPGDKPEKAVVNCLELKVSPATVFTQSGRLVTLISPPHHDIYSIERFAQLILTRTGISPGAGVSAVGSEIGIELLHGVAKANADIIQIPGHDDRLGASPLSSIATCWRVLGKLGLS